jgi:hypothetical protein
MSNAYEDDLHALKELRRMAGLYIQRGLTEKAKELMELVQRIESRMDREATVVQLDAFREQGREDVGEASN